MRNLLTYIISLAVLCPVFGAGQPNILLIVSDDHRNDVYGAYGSQLAQTPNLDRLAANGARFDRAYCNSPICSCSRQSFLTGRYPHAVGVTLLHHALDDESYTLAERLREVGYRTGAFGKMHFNSSKLYGFEIHYTPGQYNREIGPKQSRRPLPQGVEVLPPWHPFKDHARVWLNGSYLPVDHYEEDMPGTWYVREAVKFIKAHRDEPFFVQVGFHQPHSPFRFPVEFRDRLNPQDMSVPPIGPEDVPQIPKIFADLTYADKQGIAASYYTSVAFLDKKVGELLSTIDELNLRDNTLIIYLGDHGYHLGEHGRFEKHCLYENAVRAPLVMSFASQIQAGTVVPGLAEFVDIVPTVLDYVGQSVDRQAAPPRDLHGYSLRPLIEGKVKKVRDIVFSEYQHTQQAMARTERYKLIYRTSQSATDTIWIGYDPIIPPKGRAIRLYDLKNDPQEFHNIAGDPANEKIVTRLLDFLADTYGHTPPRGEKLPSTELSREDFLDWAIPPRGALKRGQ